MADTLPLKVAKRRIALVWLFGAGGPFALLAAQSLIGHYGDSAAAVWSWFLGGVSPTLGLIVAVLAADAIQRDPGTRNVDRFFYRLALGLSAAYLLALLMVILSEPLVHPEGGLPELVRNSGAWVSALQGLVTAALGVFYVRKA